MSTNVKKINALGMPTVRTQKGPLTVPVWKVLVAVIAKVGYGRITCIDCFIQFLYIGNALCLVETNKFG